MKRINESMGEEWHEYLASPGDRVVLFDEAGIATVAVHALPDGSLEVTGVGPSPAIAVEPSAANHVIVRMRDRR